MPADISNLTKRMDELLNGADKRLAEQIRQSEEEAERQQARHLLFNQLADEVVREEIFPRLEKLIEHFPHGKVEILNKSGSHGALCRFQHTFRFPATVELTLCCAHDDHVERFLCSYDLEILPVFLEFVKQDQRASPLASLARGDLALWLDDKILQFLETYLKLEFLDQYQRENQVTDPVTQTRLNRAFAAGQATYKNQTFYFLTSESQREFEAAPEQYVGL